MKIVEILKKATPTLVVILLIVSSYFLGEVNGKNKVLTTKTKVSGNYEFKNVKSLKNVSIAIDNQSRLIIFNLNNGNYQIYSEEVGKSIFEIYLNMMEKNTNEED